MKRILLACLSIFLLTGAIPESATPDGFQHWTATSLREMSGVLDAKAKADPNHSAVQQLGDFPGELFLLAHRKADGQAEWHETQADVFVVEAGSATLVVGGTLQNERTTAPHERRGSGIEGGRRVKLGTGDVVRIPARTAHQLLLDGSDTFSYFVVKVKGY